MKVLAIQLKRIGDLILTTPVLNALEAANADVTLLVDEGCASLLPAIGGIHEKLIHHKGASNRQLWRRLRAGGWDAVLDFTGNDRSAFMSLVSRGRRRITFQWVRDRWWKRLVYREWVDSPVRLAHTCDHYMDLAKPLGIQSNGEARPSLVLDEANRQAARLLLSEAGIPQRYILIHPGTARPEKYWAVAHWADVVSALRSCGYAVAVTCGPDAFEQKHARELLLRAEQLSPSDAPPMAMVTPPSLLGFAAVIENAQLVLSCDTSAVHLAAAFAKPQISIFGPTNPFHWRPRHPAAVVYSAGAPDAELTDFQPKMKGAATELVLPKQVLASADRLLKTLECRG